MQKIQVNSKEAIQRYVSIVKTQVNALNSRNEFAKAFERSERAVELLYSDKVARDILKDQLYPNRAQFGKGVNLPKGFQLELKPEVEKASLTESLSQDGKPSGPKIRQVSDLIESGARIVLEF